MRIQALALPAAVLLLALSVSPAGHSQTPAQDSTAPPKAPQAGNSAAAASEHPQLTDDQMADLHAVRKEYPEAIALYRKLAEKHPDNPIYPNKMGMAYLQQTLFGQAMKSFERALKINPKYAEAQNNIGAVWDQRRRYGKAIRAYRKALAINPRMAVTYSNLGSAYVSDRKYEEAIAAFRQALAIDPNIFEHRKSGNATLVQNRGVSDHGQFYFLLAKSFAQVGNAERCLHYLRKAKDEGYKNLASVKTDPAFAAIQKEPALEEILAPIPADVAKP